MPGWFDATMTQLSPVAPGDSFTLDIVKSNTAIEALATVELGAGLNGIATKEEVFVSVQNLSAATVPDRSTAAVDLTPANSPRAEQVRVSLAPPPAGWGVPGDVLQLVGSYKVTAGANTDFSTETSGHFIVTD